MRRAITSATTLALLALLSVVFLSGCSGNSQDNGKDSNANEGPANSASGEKKEFAASQSSYAAMTEEEKTGFVREKALLVLNKLGATRDGSLSNEALAEIRKFVDSYVRRADFEKTDSCSSRDWFRSDLSTVIVRGSKIAPSITGAFSQTGLAPEIGLYIAMIESEYCACLQSPTGLLGMYQFPSFSAKKYGLETKSGASPEDPDERCDPDKASAAEAKQMRDYVDQLVEESGKGTFGKDGGALKKDSADTILLAVTANNMGIGSLTTALKDTGGSPDVWRLIANSDKLSPQFQQEARKYVPKFIAAAIVGENPESFGIKDVKPLSGDR